MSDYQIPFPLEHQSYKFPAWTLLVFQPHISLSKTQREIADCAKKWLDGTGDSYIVREPKVVNTFGNAVLVLEFMNEAVRHQFKTLNYSRNLTVPHTSRYMSIESAPPKVSPTTYYLGTHLSSEIGVGLAFLMGSRIGLLESLIYEPDASQPTTVAWFRWNDPFICNSVKEQEKSYRWPALDGLLVPSGPWLSTTRNTAALRKQLCLLDLNAKRVALGPTVGFLVEPLRVRKALGKVVERKVSLVGGVWTVYRFDVVCGGQWKMGSPKEIWGSVGPGIDLNILKPTYFDLEHQQALQLYHAFQTTQHEQTLLRGGRRVESLQATAQGDFKSSNMHQPRPPPHLGSSIATRKTTRPSPYQR